jgi:plastocyanin
VLRRIAPSRGGVRLRIGAGLVAIVLVAVGAAVALAAGSGPAPQTQVTIEIKYSHFNPSAITVPVGVPVTITLVNDDPIDHEWIIGDDQIQQKHRTGTELLHPVRPTEQVVPALSTRVTTITFDTPVVWKYICHLPGHEAYGMVGVATIVR